MSENFEPGCFDAKPLLFTKNLRLGRVVANEGKAIRISNGLSRKSCLIPPRARMGGIRVMPIVNMQESIISLFYREFHAFAPLQ